MVSKNNFENKLKLIIDYEKKNFDFNKNILRACSSVVERFVDIEEVISSILIMPTKFIFLLTIVKELKRI